MRAPRRLLLVTKPDDRPDELVIEATLTADGDRTVLVIEERGMPLPHIADYGAGWCMSRISPPTLPGVSAATSGAVGRAEPCLPGTGGDGQLAAAGP
jgi:hypothetical protein